MGRLSWIIQVNPIKPYKSLVTEDFYGLWSERNVVSEEGPEKYCFENGGACIFFKLVFSFPSDI